MKFFLTMAMVRWRGREGILKPYLARVATLLLEAASCCRVSHQYIALTHHVATLLSYKHGLFVMHRLHGHSASAGGHFAADDSCLFREVNFPHHMFYVDMNLQKSTISFKLSNIIVHCTEAVHDIKNIFHCIKCITHTKSY